MTEGNFVDYVKLFVTSGNGGSGSTHLRRENLLQGGQMEAMVAGHVHSSQCNLWTLYPFKFKNISVLVTENQEARS